MGIITPKEIDRRLGPKGIKAKNRMGIEEVSDM
jgi:hypothetical protein